MNRIEALRILGLDEDASIEDVKTAYKEMAQILHPDRFASKKKLQDRATEQFKILQEAYDFLMSDKGAARRGSSAASQSRGYSPTNEYEARLAGIAAARTQLVAQRDMMLDERRNALIIGALGVVVALFFRRFPIGLALGSTAVIWGIVKLISALSTIKNLDEHLKRLKEEQQRIAEEFDDID
ncbi:MAG: J domain-containing protein [Raoultibacter sp.]|jgi:curved DNA-binding protein CbpA